MGSKGVFHRGDVRRFAKLQVFTKAKTWASIRLYRYLQSLVVCLHGCALVEIEGKARRTSARTAPVSTGDTIGLILVSLSDTHAPIQLGGPHDLELQGSPDGTGLRRRRGQRLPRRRSAGRSSQAPQAPHDPPRNGSRRSTRPAGKPARIAKGRPGRPARSVRVNDQFRICFVWRDGTAHEVEFVDYHR